MAEGEDDNVFSLQRNLSFETDRPLPLPCPQISFAGYLSGNVTRKVTGEWVCQVVILPEYQDAFTRVVSNSQQVLLFTVEAWNPEASSG